MKLSTKLFILFQILDIALTFFAIRWGLATEMNPLGFTPGLIIYKFVATLTVAFFLEKLNFGKLAYILVGFPLLVVIWNIINIVFSLVLYFR